MYERQRGEREVRERERDKQTDRQRHIERQRDQVVKEKSSHVAIVCVWVKLPNTRSFCFCMTHWVSFVYKRHWPSYVCSCEQPFGRKLINRRQTFKKKLKEKRSELAWSVTVVTRKRGAKIYFIWGLSGEELSKLNISSQSKAQCGFRTRKTDRQKVIEKTKICIPAMLKPCSASSFCLPNKNRVGVARGDGTNLEVVYKLFLMYILVIFLCLFFYFVSDYHPLFFFVAYDIARCTSEN